MAPHGTLLGWVQLGSISLASLVADPDLEEHFRALVEDTYAASLRELCGAVAVH